MTQRYISTKILSGPASALFVAGLMAVALAAPQIAQAQFSETYKFIEAVRKGDNAAILKALEAPGVTPVNTKDRNTGETPLHITVARRDLVLVTYLLQRGAKPDAIDDMGRTPLMVAVEKRFVEGAQQLLAKRANPNLANNSGETPIIRATQLGDLEMVRALLSAGADPNRRDTIAGMSAIDYAKRDNRGAAMIDLLNTKAKMTPSKGVQGPQL